jgi:hypothetical protein
MYKNVGEGRANLTRPFNLAACVGSLFLAHGCVLFDDRPPAVSPRFICVLAALGFMVFPFMGH